MSQTQMPSDGNEVQFDARAGIGLDEVYYEQGRWMMNDMVKRQVIIPYRVNHSLNTIPYCLASTNIFHYYYMRKVVCSPV